MGFLNYFLNRNQRIDDSIKKAFDNVRLDINLLNENNNKSQEENTLIKKKLSDIIFDYNNLKHHYKSVVSHYSISHNSNLKHHENIFSQINELNRVFSELESTITDILNVLINKLEQQSNLSVQFNERIDVIETQQTTMAKTMNDLIYLIKRIYDQYEITNPKSNKSNDKTNTTNIVNFENKNSQNQSQEDLKITKETISRLSEKEMQILKVIYQLSLENGSNIFVNDLLFEIYHGKKERATSLSNYLSNLEKLGFIRRIRKGRNTQINIINSEFVKNILDIYVKNSSY